MSNTIKPSQTSESLISSFFDTYEIRTLAIVEATSLDKKTISEVQILFIHDAKEGERDYSVKFKLLEECIDIYEYIKTFDTKTDVSVELNEKGKELSQEELDELIKTFFDTITTRVKKIRKEESVQAITYVGNTFTLYNTTTFKVLSDDGEGRLEIEILSKDKSMQEAGMTSHSLLDGLYSGAIQLVEG